MDYIQPSHSVEHCIAHAMSAAPKRKHPYTRKRTVQQMSEEEREYLQKLERNKVAFEAWLEKKKYEQAVSQCARLLWFHISCGLNPIPAASSCSSAWTLK